MTVYDLTVIGGGPGGYVCAIRASQLGLRVALIERRETIGGTCTNVGCIPTKALLESTERYYSLAHGEMETHGIRLEKPTLDFGAMIDRKNRIVKELTDGLAFLMKKNKIDVLRGTGVLARHGDPIEINIPELSQTVQTKKCVIATGSAPRPLVLNAEEIPFDGKVVIHSDHAVSPESCPKRLAIVGGGVIGLEMASIYSRAGSETTVIEFLPDILLPVDRQIREAAKRAYAAQGIKILTGREITALTRSGESVTIGFKDKNGSVEATDADRLLIAVGRSPFTEGIGAREIGVEIDKRGFIRVNPNTLETGVPGVYAIGDVTAGPMLAHRASEEGVMAAEIIAGKPGHVNRDAIPFIVYTSPEVAWVGRGEEQCKNEGIAVKTGRFLFRPNGRAKAMNLTEGMAKIIADAKSDRILGVQIVGAHASELIAEAVIAMEFGASSEDIARSFHAHPTLSEILHEAALDADGRAIHS